jgi:hypothetical protein
MADSIAQSNEETNCHGRDQEIIDLYFRGLSYGDIAKAACVTRGVVAGVIRRNGVKCRGGDRKPFHSLVGQTFGRLTVIRDLGTNGKGAHRYRCACSCGNFKNVLGSQLISQTGKVRSCGCLWVENARKQLSVYLQKRRAAA